MTDAEKLAIAEKLLSGYPYGWSVKIDGIEMLRCRGGSNWRAQASELRISTYHSDPFVAFELTKRDVESHAKKLAAEAEAAKSTRERELEEALRNIIQDVKRMEHGGSHRFIDVLGIMQRAETALQGA